MDMEKGVGIAWGEWGILGRGGQRRKIGTTIRALSIKYFEREIKLYNIWQKRIYTYENSYFVYYIKITYKNEWLMDFISFPLKMFLLNDFFSINKNDPSVIFHYWLSFAITEMEPEIITKIA